MSEAVLPEILLSGSRPEAARTPAGRRLHESGASREDARDTLFGEGGGDVISAGARNDFATGQMDRDHVDGDAGDDALFGGPADDVVRGGEGGDDLIGNFGSDVLLGGEGDDRLLGDNPPPPVPLPNPPPEEPSHDVCNGQRGTDFAVVGTCEQENQIELIGPFPEG